MQLYSSYKDGKLTLFLQGELDHHEAKTVMQGIEQILEEYMPRDCALDLAHLSFMDSSGIALILKTYRHLRDIGGRTWIENARDQPLKVIDAAGIDRIIKISVSREV